MLKLPLISHEMPHDLHDYVLTDAQTAGEYINDYMFVLLHRYIDDPVYKAIVDRYDGFKIMDNSCFELGAALSNELIAQYFHIMKPDVFVLPDVLGDMEETIGRSFDFMTDYPELTEYAMAVIQGNTTPEFLECYKVFDAVPNLAMIGIPFCFNWAMNCGVSPRDHSLVRVKLLQNLEPIINKDRRHHLLGTWCAEEFKEYHSYDWVYSIDTSNPVAAAIESNIYVEGEGVSTKPKIKFDKFADMFVTSELVHDIIVNVGRFRRIAKRPIKGIKILKEDKINPVHYRAADSIQVIDVIEHWDLDFKRGNVVKYVLRAGQKAEEGYKDIAKEIEDLTKAKWYLERTINNLNKMVK
tara:strand:- start:2684 stop:3745 length:1062 start_codon:yes stop_codon:yes gene_type:complete